MPDPFVVAFVVGVTPGKWARAWGELAEAIGFVAQPWMSASIFSFVVAAALTLAVGGVSRLTGRRSPARQANRDECDVTPM